MLLRNTLPLVLLFICHLQFVLMVWEKMLVCNLCMCFVFCFFDILFIAKCTLNRIHVSHKAIIVLYVFCDMQKRKNVKHKKTNKQ